MSARTGDACERCGVRKAIKHLVFTYSGPWNMCALCALKLIALHANGGKPKGDRERKTSFPAWFSQRPYTPERRTVNRSRSRPWSPEERARKVRRVA
jgi:hypothetical protein